MNSLIDYAGVRFRHSRNNDLDVTGFTIALSKSSLKLNCEKVLKGFVSEIFLFVRFEVAVQNLPAQKLLQNKIDLLVSFVSSGSKRSFMILKQCENEENIHNVYYLRQEIYCRS